MNDSLLYFLFYTVCCFGIGFAAGGIHEARKAHKALDEMYCKYKESLAALGEAHEKHIASICKYVDRGHDSSEYTPIHTA